MASVQPWTTCLLTCMLIDYLETRYPDAAGRLDYRKIVSACEGFEDIPDPRAFLRDPNNWIPHTILREMYKCCEGTTGEKDFAYLAALAFYRSASNRSPTIVDTIANLLSSVETVLLAAAHWASAFNNYLQFQAFSRPAEGHTMYVLSRFHLAQDPLFSSARFVQGNIEGIVKFDPQLEAVSSEEQFSQVPLHSLVSEFGEHYLVIDEFDKTKVVRKSTGQVVVVARPITLIPEWIPVTVPPSEAWLIGEDRELICQVRNGGFTVLSPSEEHQRSGSLPTETAETVRALRVEQGGDLYSGSLRLRIQEGAIFGAPYTRYRITWRKRHGSASPHAVESTAMPPSDKRSFARLLFHHLKGLQATQRQNLIGMIPRVELTQENIECREEPSAQQETGGLLGKSKATQDLLDLIRTVAVSDTTVLINGETGSGKELAARLIHQLSRRRDHRFLAVNCGALAESLLESELFGHERGAFTGAISQKKGKFELAAGGTLFLDEIGDVSSAVQVRLLRVLQEKEFQRVGGSVDLKVDVRLIAATNRDLDAMMERNEFRRDLYYRLNVIQINVPPLRERKEDLPMLAEHFIRRFAGQAGKSIKGLSPEAVNFCLGHQWPGNVRELENAMERAVTLAPEHRTFIGADLLPPSVHTPAATGASLDLMDLVNQMEGATLLQSVRKTGSLTCLLNQLEWAISHRAVEEYGGNKSRAARALGRSYRWLRKLEIEMMDVDGSGSLLETDCL